MLQHLKSGLGVFVHGDAKCQNLRCGCAKREIFAADDPGSSRTLPVSVQMKDPAFGAYQTLTVFPASIFTTTAAELYFDYPGAVETAPQHWVAVQGLPLPRTWRIHVPPQTAHHQLVVLVVFSSSEEPCHGHCY